MKRLTLVITWLLMTLTFDATIVAAATNDNAAAEHLNIIFILIDDLGKEWVGCYGAENIATPNIDRLAAGGMKFTNAYSMPQCTPTRVCLLTGQYPFRNGWVNHWDVPRWGVGYFDWNLNPCLARVMKSAGYRTAIAGKWQINDFRIHPQCLSQMGFDDYCMWTGGEGNPDNRHHERISTQRYWDPYIHTKAGSRTYDGQFGPDIYNQFVLDFIEENKDKPFFVYYPMALTHGPLVHTPLEPNVTTPVDKHKAMVRYADVLLGKITKQLDTCGLLEKTLIIWTTDNGTSRGIRNRMNGRLVQGGKGETTENGINAPFIASCPGVVPSGIVSDALVDFSDIAPTFAAIAGTKLQDGFTYDGHSFAEVLTGDKLESNRSWILAMGGKPGVPTESGIENVYRYRDRVVREKTMKLFVGSDREPTKLVDLSNDPTEQQNLIHSPMHTKTLQRLTDVIKDFPRNDADPFYDKNGYPSYRGKLKKSAIHKRP